MRDKRDPQKLGMALLAIRRKDAADGRDRTLSQSYDANARSLADVDIYDKKHVGPVQKYGRPDAVVLIEEAKAPVFART